MAEKGLFRRRVLRGLSLSFFGTLLALLAHNLHDHETNVLKKVNVVRSVGTFDLESSPHHRLSSTLEPRQTYQCGPGNPCSNGACCGTGGYCGYGDFSVKIAPWVELDCSSLSGPTYCGSGCVSNCDAVAECGQYAPENSTECPLNTCCSQYGFVSLQT